MNAISERDKIAAERAAIDESKLTDEERLASHRAYRSRLISAAFSEHAGAHVTVEINGETVFEKDIPK